MLEQTEKKISWLIILRRYHFLVCFVLRECTPFLCNSSYLPIYGFYWKIFYTKIIHWWVAHIFSYYEKSVWSNPPAANCKNNPRRKSEKMIRSYNHVLRSKGRIYIDFISIFSPIFWNTHPDFQCFYCILECHTATYPILAHKDVMV